MLFIRVAFYEIVICVLKLELDAMVGRVLSGGVCLCIRNFCLLNGYDVLNS